MNSNLWAAHKLEAQHCYSQNMMDKSTHVM